MSYCDGNMLYHDIQYRDNTLKDPVTLIPYRDAQPPYPAFIKLYPDIITSFYYNKEQYLDITKPYHDVNVSCPHIIVT